MPPKSTNGEPLDELPPLADSAYEMYLKGSSQRAISRELHLDRQTVKRYIEALHKEHLQRSRTKRPRLLSESVARLRQVEEHAWQQYVADGGNVAALNTVIAAEREVAKMQGLYDAVADDDENNYGVTVTITKRGAVVRPTGQRSAEVVTHDNDANAQGEET